MMHVGGATTMLTFCHLTLSGDELMCAVSVKICILQHTKDIYKQHLTHRVPKLLVVLCGFTLCDKSHLPRPRQKS